jgi:hypothetical protein
LEDLSDAATAGENDNDVVTPGGCTRTAVTSAIASRKLRTNNRRLRDHHHDRDVGERQAPSASSRSMSSEAPLLTIKRVAQQPGRSAHDALAACRQRCWKYDWGKRRDETVMREGMRTPYVEVLATYDGRESCVGDPRGRSEALTAVRAGWVSEPRNQLHRGADAVPVGGRQHRRRRYRESSGNPARSGNLRMHGALMSENRESPWSPAAVMAGRAARGRPRP